MRPYLRHIFEVLGTKDTKFINLDPTGPLDRGIMLEDDPKSGISRGRSQLTEAASRIKQEI